MLLLLQLSQLRLGSCQLRHRRQHQQQLSSYNSGPDLSGGPTNYGGGSGGGGGGGGSVDLWRSERPSDMANIADLQVMCGKRHMEVQLTFDRPFNGIVFSKGAVDRYDCIYVKPQTGLQTYKFDIMYDSCGSKPDLNGKFYENNIVVQVSIAVEEGLCCCS